MPLLQSSVPEFRDRYPLLPRNNSRHPGAGGACAAPESRILYCVMRPSALSLSSEYGVDRLPARSRVLLLLVAGLPEAFASCCIRPTDARTKALMLREVQSVDTPRGTPGLAPLLRIRASRRGRYYEVLPAQIYESRVPGNAYDTAASHVGMTRAAMCPQAYLFARSVAEKFFSIR